MSWYVVILMWLLYLVRDLTPSPSPWEMEEAAESSMFSQVSFQRPQNLRWKPQKKGSHLNQYQTILDSWI